MKNHSRRILGAAGLGALLCVMLAGGPLFAQPARAPLPQKPPAAAPSAAPSAAPEAPPPPSAPPLSEALTGPARTEYDLAKILYRDGDFGGAVVKFQRSYELSKDPRLLWNIAACEKSLRHYTRVLALLERYRKEAAPTLSADEQKAAGELIEIIKPFVSTVTIEVNEPGATIAVDGEELGVSPLPAPLTIDMGSHEIAASKPGFSRQSRAEKLAGGSALQLSFKLDKEVHEGNLLVTAGPKDVIALDGKVLASGRYQGSVPSGGHTLRVTGPGMRPTEREVVIEDHKTRELQITLEPAAKSSMPYVLAATGVAVLGGLVVGGYFLFKPKETTTPGTISPYQVALKGFRFGGASW